MKPRIHASPALSFETVSSSSQNSHLDHVAKSSGICGELAKFDSLPRSAHVRLPVVRGLFGCSSATVWRRVKNKLLPAPKRFGDRVSAWNVGELRDALMNFCRAV
jgi:predicted DNA-binding transcriptional regulator AlpA